MVMIHILFVDARRSLVTDVIIFFFIVCNYDKLSLVMVIESNMILTMDMPYFLIFLWLSTFFQFMFEKYG